MTTTDAGRRLGARLGPQLDAVRDALRPVQAWWRRVQRGGSSTRLGVGEAVAHWVLLSVAGLTAWLVLFGVAFSALAEHHQQHSLYVQLRKALADGVAPVGGPVREGSPVALLQAPAGGLRDLVVVEGTTSSDLRAGPGHFPGSPLPGQPGAVLIMGRSATFGGPFGNIIHLRPGDPITATTGQGAYTYIVEDVRRPGDRVPSALASGGSQLTLVTSEGSGWRSGWAPTHQVYVDAMLKGAAAPAGASTGLPSAADNAMSSDTGGIYKLVLWLQLLAIVVVLIVVGRARWGTSQAWLAGTPVLLAALWGATSSLWPLLPNLF